MALIVKDRVQETTTTSGTGTITLAGAVSGFQSFSTIGNGNTTYYTIVDGTSWEVGIGTYTSAGTTLSRDTVLSNSLGTTAKISLSGGTSQVFVTYAAGKAVYQDASNNVTLPGTLTSTGETTPSVTATTTDLTLSAISTGNLNLNTAGGTGLRVSDVASSVRYVTFNGASASGSPGFFASAGSLAQSGGANSNISFYTNLFAQEQMRVSHTASAVNYVQVTGSATTKAPIYSVAGSDTNISMAFQPKGTGAIDLAAGSSGVNISNGGTVTAITRSGNGTGYTSKPTIAIIAPTTAGGVQATATIDFMSTNATAIVSGGTGYTVGDTLTVVGGTPVASATTMTVSTVSAGVITGVTIANFGSYSTLPTNPVSVTGGTGSSATFNITFSIGNAFTITAAGSGYIEQPTVTFSGGGGSGAAAYATVGSSVRLQSLGTTSELAFAFRGASGINSPTAPDILRILDVAAVNDTGIFIQNSGFGRAQIQAYGNANANLFLCANGSGRVTFTTSGTSLVEQMRVAHTASAVNYVQVTGSATATQPVISAQGSDASVGLRLQWKGQANMFFVSGAGAYTQFRLLGANNAVNNLAVSGTVAGSAPILSAEGSDTNIDLALTPKGTGGVAINSAIKLGAGLDAGTSGYVMTSAGTGASPTWTASTAGGMTLLGTITTTSGTSVSLSSLVLTSYKQVLCVFSVSNSGTTGNFTMTDPNTTTFTLAGWPGNAAQTVTGSLTIDLSSGVVFGAAKNNTSTTLPDVNSAGNAIVGKTTFSTATTSLTFGASAGAFDAGSILVYGIK